MRDLDSQLLDASRGDVPVTTSFNATLNAHGLYDALRFVVRLSPRVHELMSRLPEGSGLVSGTKPEEVQAFSTYLHETIHWWQHIGSTCGFMLSLSYPAQTHVNLNHLRRFIEVVGPVKSIRAYSAAATGSSLPGTPLGLANTIVNNQFDIHSYRLLATNPERASALVNEPLFESVGHAYEIALGQAIFALASTFDRDFHLIPDPREWEKEFTKLREAREEGFYYGSPVTLSPVGAYHIFEGQARFAQLQYLHFASGGAFDWPDAKRAGMMAPIYTAAFETFLKRSGLERPPTIDHPVVGLFLLVCDLAMNPGEGFPLPIWSWTSFITDVNPGLRFLHLCMAVRLFCPDVSRAILHYSAAEYEAVSNELCAVLRTYTPLDICKVVEQWVEKGSTFRECVDLHQVGKAASTNPPLHLLFGQFASFARDKRRHPHIICWPGATMAGPNAIEESAGVFSRQSPLFIDRAQDEMIVPILRSGVREEDMMETFHQFYGAHALYDLTAQWIVAPGPFTYDYAWLQPVGTKAEVKKWADDRFAGVHGVPPDEFTILN